MATLSLAWARAGSLITGTLIVMLWCMVTCKTPKWEIKRTLWAGLVSGSVWQIGNVCQVIAQSYYLLPYAIAYPIFQASLVLSGILGIFVFHEITGASSIATFFLCATIVVGGSVVLALYGPV